MTIERASLEPPPTCRIDWQPDALTQVFFGFRDLTPATGHRRPGRGC